MIWVFSIVPIGTDFYVLKLSPWTTMLKCTIGLERDGQKLSPHLWPLEIFSSYIRILYWKWLNMNMMLNTHINFLLLLLLLFLAWTYGKVVILFWCTNIIDFKTSNIWNIETTCQIDFKLTGFNVWTNRSLHTNFQVILMFYIWKILVLKP